MEASLNNMSETNGLNEESWRISEMASMNW